MPEKSPPNGPEYRVFVKLLTLGSTTFVLALLGLWLDKKFNTLPACTVIGIALGILYSFYEAWLIHNEK